MERLLTVLSDGQWHTTAELARKVGHTFVVAKFVLVRRGYEIVREPHPSRRHQHLYRLVSTPKDEAPF
jgi:hypothetical protein